MVEKEIQILSLDEPPCGHRRAHRSQGGPAAIRFADK
jgi:hypothetical protein